MTRIIERNGYFSIEKMQELFKSLGPTVSLDIQSHIVSPVRVGLQGVIKEHFGHDMVDEIFNYFSRKLANTDLTFMAEENSQNIVDLFILLKRKPFD
ncbi:SAM dependent carboxyl methyltransferase [Corchorus capsularis]|uniref:SAM dependent carboxyl methyltransferase n=1 Tax=Corchorus capsularis TaxID=210143 RepID=A0A1R3KZ62_COCAP|nr:SAM dependent carboxyl methyltransferase [Corchorus capsularis]